MTSVAARLEHIRAAMRTAALAAARSPGDVRLIAVSKTKPAADIEAVLAAGQRVFGENRVQEAAAKFPALCNVYPDIELHLIGPLQTNKADDAVALFDVIQTLDRPRLADALAKSMRKLDRAPKLYVEVNIGREPQKSGITPEDLDAFLIYCRGQGLRIEGLMCIPPHDADPKPFFKAMKQLAAQHNLPRLSMGMSGDYGEAIACGATEVRVGSALFGARAPKSESGI